jgi:hypothetical protein
MSSAVRSMGAARMKQKCLECRFIEEEYSSIVNDLQP